MKLYEFEPQKNVKRLTALISVMFFGAAGVILLTLIDSLPFKGVFQLIAIIMLCVGVFFTSRFIMRAYAYRIESTDTGRDFTVTELQGKSVITVCRLSLSGICEVRVTGADERRAAAEIKARAKKEQRKIFNYCVDIVSARTLWIFAEECGERVCVRLSYDEKLCELLSSAADAHSEVD